MQWGFEHKQNHATGPNFFNSSYKKNNTLTVLQLQIYFQLKLLNENMRVYSVQKTGGCSRECMHAVLFCCPQHESITCISALSSPYMTNFLQVLRKSTLRSHHVSCNKNHFFYMHFTCDVFFVYQYCDYACQNAS